MRGLAAARTQPGAEPAPRGKVAREEWQGPFCSVWQPCEQHGTWLGGYSGGKGPSLPPSLPLWGEMRDGEPGSFATLPN